MITLNNIRGYLIIMSQIYNQLIQDMKAAMRKKEKHLLTTIRMAISAVKLKEIDDKITITDDVVTVIITKMIKQRQDSYNQYIQADRPELAQDEENEIKILQVYMPKQLTESEIILIIENGIKSVGSTSMKDMGKIMTNIKSQLSGKADMSRVSSIVKSNLN